MYYSITIIIIIVIITITIKTDECFPMGSICTCIYNHINKYHFCVTYRMYTLYI